MINRYDCSTQIIQTSNDCSTIDKKRESTPIPIKGCYFSMEAEGQSIKEKKTHEGTFVIAAGGTVVARPE
mgnify:CR=1 FL=1